MATSFTAVLCVFAAIAVRASDSAATVSCSHSVNQAEVSPCRDTFSSTERVASDCP